MNKDKRNFWAILIVALGLILILFINRKSDTSFEAARRPYQEYNYTIIIDPPVPLGIDLENYALSEDILRAVNKEREALGLKSFVYSNSLSSAGQVRAVECETLFSHTRPNGSPWYTVNETIMFGENLSAGYETAEDIVNAWMNSPTHRDLLCDKEFQTFGIGIYKGAGDILYVAGEFGY